MTPEQYTAFLAGPVTAPPEGQTQNLVNPPDLKTEGLAIGVVFWSLATALVACHAYTIFRLLRKVSFEDVLLYISWGFFTVFIGIALWICFIPIGLHQWNITWGQYRTLLRRLNANLVLFGITIAFLKAAITIKCLKVFVPKGHRNFMFWASWILVWGHTLFYVLYVFLLIFACNPLRATWDILERPGARCIDQSALTVVSGFINSVTDVILLILPHFVIWKLNMPTRRKKALSILFGLGVIVCAASICRLYYVLEYRQTEDSYNVGIQGLVAAIELALGFLIACLPLMPKFFAVVLGIPLFRPVNRHSGDVVAMGTVHAGTRHRSKFFNFHTRHAGESDKNLVHDPHTITITQTYQVLFEDADPLTLRSSSGVTDFMPRDRTTDSEGPRRL